MRRKLHRWEAYRKNEIRQDVLRILSRMKVIEVPDLQFEKGFTFGFDIARPEDLEELVTMLRADLMRMVQAKKQIASFADKKAAHP